MKLVLMDVDMTLVSTLGAGISSLEQAIERRHGVAGPLREVEFAGRTDRVIFEDCLARAGLDSSEESVMALRSTYVARLAGNLSSGWPASPLPGVVPLLERLRGRPEACIGLLTGNWREGAWLKLAASGIDRFFGFGSFAENGRERHELVPAALSLARTRSGCSFLPGDVWVVGDTPHDVSCGMRYGFRTLAVATGPYTTGALEGTGADVVLPDLSSTDEVLSILLGPGSGSGAEAAG